MTQWNVTFRVFRCKQGNSPYYDEFTIKVVPEEFILDAVERIWAFHDRSLCYNHACHHSTCGACGMRINHREKLTCITPIHAVTRDGGTVLVEPLRTFPLISDLAVDMTSLYTDMTNVGAPTLDTVNGSEKLPDCIECGLCISVCPASQTSAEYVGPAPLAATPPKNAGLVNNQHGVWRCHSAFECSEVCPSFVEPAKRIMELRRSLIQSEISLQFFVGER